MVQHGVYSDDEISPKLPKSTKTQENTQKTSPTLTPRPNDDELLDDTSNQNSGGESPEVDETSELVGEVENDEEILEETPRNTRNGHYRLRQNPNPNFSDLYRYYMLRF